MKRAWLLLACACGPQVVLSDADGTSTSGGATASDTSSSSTTSGSSSSEGSTGWSLDLATPDVPPEEVLELDVLFVIDNSANMADIQLWLAQAMPTFVAALSTSPHDVQVMFTTTDMGYPACESSSPAAKGSPVMTSCNNRIGDFSDRSDACTSVCHSIWNSREPFVAFDTATGETNADPPDAALACLLPQGVTGCGYEAPLEAMAQALNPDAWWNEGERPFLREGADLAIVIASDESDCSLADQNATMDPMWWSFDPGMGSAHASSALCWNAGITCEGPDADGVYTECTPREGPLHPTSRYVDMLYWLRDGGKRVTMLALTGVPEVTQYSATSPFEPIAGGLAELVYHDWRDADLFADEPLHALMPEDLQFQYGIGPACLAAGDDGTRLARALPSPRLFEVCEALDEPGRIGCCIDSACSDPSAGLRCLLATAEL